jgi:hypothetical protein
MINLEPGYTSQNSSTTVDPTRVPSLPLLKIRSNDPRNNWSYLQDLDRPYEIIYVEEEDSSDEYYEGLDSEYLSHSDPLSIANSGLGPARVYNDVVMDEVSPISLRSPENLTILTNSYRLNDYSSAGDGSVYWTASLYFDDVDGAEDYEYSITAVER